MNKINLEILKISSIFKKINKIKMAFKKVKDPNGENKKGEYILTKNTTAIKKVKIKIESYFRDELVTKVVDRHGSFRLKTKSLYFTWIWGKLQSGKTRTIDGICQEILKAFKMNVVATTTLDDIMLNDQLKEDLKKSAIVLKITEFHNKTEDEVVKMLQGSNLLIIDEGDYGMGKDGRVAQLINKIIVRCKIHVVYVGATNYTGLLAQLSTPENEIDIVHYGLKANKGYFGLQEFTKNKNIIDIETDNYTIDKSTGNISKPIRDLIVSQNEAISGLNIIRVSARSTKDKTSITLANKVVNCIQKDKRFFDYKFVLMFDTNERKLRDEFDTAQRMTLAGEKVIVIVISGLKAGIAIWKELKEQNKLRFCYETSTVASSGAQGLPGRFCGYYIDNDGNGKPFPPTSKIICNTKNIEYYNEVNDMIDVGELELPETTFDKGSRPTTHIPQSERMVKSSIPATLVFKGDWNMADEKYKKDGDYASRIWSSFGTQGKKEYSKAFDEWFSEWKPGYEINVNEYTSGEFYNREEFPPYYIFVMNNKRNKCPIMVFELNDTKPNKKLTRKVKLSLKDGYSPVLTNG
jgi:hypothetical protein